MFLAFELKQPLEYVLNMDPEEYTRWMAFFKIKAKYEKKAAEEATRRGRR